jgi:PAS domain S-box-containing protein
MGGRMMDGTVTSTEARSATAGLALRKREDLFRQVVEAAPNAMVMIDAAGRIEMVNAQAERVFGYLRSELLGQRVEMLVPERFRGHHPRLRASFLADPRARPMGAGRELYARRKDGSEFPVEIGLNPIETEDGPMVLSAVVDISERKRLEERFRQVVEAAPNAMVMINAAGRIEMVNAQAELVFGYARAELLGQGVEMLVPDRFRDHHPGLRHLFFADPHARPMGAGRELFARRKDGSEFPVEIGLNPIETEDGPMVLSAIVDISDRKQREAGIRAALAEKDILLGEIHQRVKNNLQIFYSLLDLQSARMTDQLALGMLRDSQNRIRSMALIHQTLYESKDFAEVDFGRFLETLVPMLIASYGVDANRITLSIDAEQVLLPIGSAIPCGLVVPELISNALKHAFPSGNGGTIEVTLRHAERGDVVLSVSDTGIGVPEQIRMTGTGTLGLQLVSLLADQLGGNATMQRSDPTRFTLRFPLRHANGA